MKQVMTTMLENLCRYTVRSWSFAIFQSFHCFFNFKNEGERSRAGIGGNCGMLSKMEESVGMT